LWNIISISVTLHGIIINIYDKTTSKNKHILIITAWKSTKPGAKEFVKFDWIPIALLWKANYPVIPMIRSITKTNSYAIVHTFLRLFFVVDTDVANIIVPPACIEKHNIIIGIVLAAPINDVGNKLIFLKTVSLF